MAKDIFLSITGCIEHRLVLLGLGTAALRVLSREQVGGQLILRDHVLDLVVAFADHHIGSVERFPVRGQRRVVSVNILILQLGAIDGRGAVLEAPVQ